jgi:hypothetical protein
MSYDVPTLSGAKRERKATMPTELPPRWTGKPPPATQRFYETLKLEVGRFASWLARALKR